jgi:aminoglycoside phosphotransferase (APT) family kinase protein
MNHGERDRILQIWRLCAATPEWAGPPLWIHGDMHPANVLVSRGHVSAIVDFIDLSAGDPAVDLAIAWMIPAKARDAFRVAASAHRHDIDEAMWMRGRGWALHLGLIFLTTSERLPHMASLGDSTIRAVLNDSSE